jgi:hypothetical protein
VANGQRPATAKRSAAVGTAPARAVPPQQSTTGIFALTSTDTAVFAATEDGVLTSTDNGHTWSPVRSAHARPFHMVAAQGERVLLADQRGLTLAAPPALTYLSGTAIDDHGRLWVGGREGVFFSEDDGASWKSQPGLFVPDISSVYFDKASSRILVTSNYPGTLIFSVHTPDMKVSYQDSGWGLRTVRPVADHLIGITPYDGVVLEPRMVVSELKPSK